MAHYYNFTDSPQTKSPTVRNLILFLILSFSITIADAQHRNKSKQNVTDQNTDQSGQNSNTDSKINSGVNTKDSVNNKSLTFSVAHKPSPDTVIRIGLILPFNAQSSIDKLNATVNDEELSKVENSGIKESTKEALDFYEGLKYALTTDTTRQKIAFYIFDSQNSDSLVQELVKDDSLKACDIIIGPTSFNQARTVAAFCKKNKIINIQPFVASKSFSTENQYLVRFMPTIDAHLQKEYEMVMDSFSDANVVILTTRRERDITSARQLDTLFSSYNDINPNKLKYAFFNLSDSTLPPSQRMLSYYLHPHERNVVMITCYDESVINSQLRIIKENTTVFGMPTWIDAEQIRIDYLNKSAAYFTDNFYVDSTKAGAVDFINGYSEIYAQKPSRHAYMGYDAMRYLYQIFRKYGKGFTQGFNNESYDGLGYSFHISPVINISKTSGEPIINCYTNTAMHLFQIDDYKVWLVN